jgi:hypothetical protein
VSDGPRGTSDDGPTFAEPWQARAFALAVSLTDEQTETGGDRPSPGTDEVSDAPGEQAHRRYHWREFQQELVAEIDAHDLELDDDAIRSSEGPTHRPGDEERYYQQWLSALEHLLTTDGVVHEDALRERALAFERGERDAHEFVDGDPHDHAERLPEGHADGSDHTHTHPHGEGHDHGHGHSQNEGHDHGQNESHSHGHSHSHAHE